MAAKRGSHSRPDNQAFSYPQYPNNQKQASQGTGSKASGQSEAYERAYRKYVQEQERSGRNNAQQPPYSGQNPQQAYQRQATQRAYQQRAQKSGYRQASSYAAYGQQPAMRNFEVSKKKKGHPVRNTIIVLLVILIIVGGVGGFTGYTLYNSAKTVRTEASAVMSDLSDLKSKIVSDDPSQANATVSDIVKHSKNMEEELSGWEWTVASYVPVYGSDINKVRELSDILKDLSTDTLTPLVQDISQVKMSNLVVDGSINIELANSVITALNEAAPAIQQANQRLENIGEAHLEQINGPVKKAQEQLGKLATAMDFVSGIAPSFTDMLGANGRKTYLIVAQSNAEIRATGGFLGSVGPMYVDNGHIDLGDFRGITDIYPDMNNGAPLTDEELAIFGSHVGWQIADCNFIPDFGRVGEIVKYAWELKGYEAVDGVIGVDPVFLQQMLAIAGPITTSNGTVVDGTNAARILLHDAYYLPTNAEQDALFEEVAAMSFKQLMSNLGGVSMTQLAGNVRQGIENRRLQLWMVDGGAEQSIEAIGADGKLSHDSENPTLGVYFIDESYSKMFWYMKADVTTGDAVKNADGSSTYPVTVSYRNMIQDVGELSNTMVAHNPVQRSPGEMITWVMLSAPEGGFISDCALVEGEFMPEGTHYRDYGSYVSGTMTPATLQGLDFWYGLSRTLPGGTFTISFNVTTSPNATEPLRVVRTPTAQEAAGW